MRTPIRSPRPVLGSLVAFVVLVLAAPAHAAPPPAASPVAPAGVVTGSTHVFTWSAADGATFYYLQVNDATASPRLLLWYPAGQACPGGSATCSVTLTTGFAAGPATWWVQTWNPDGPGPWSAGMSFTVDFVPPAWAKSLPAAERFQLVLGGTGVLDRETGLVWSRSPSGFATYGFIATDNCLGWSAGGRRGWRLARIEELLSLTQPGQTNPALPPGHPFTLVSNIQYWTATRSVTDATRAWTVDMSNGGWSTVDTNTLLRFWCVRSGHGPDAQ